MYNLLHKSAYLLQTYCSTITAFHETSACWYITGSESKHCPGQSLALKSCFIDPGLDPPLMARAELHLEVLR